MNMTKLYNNKQCLNEFTVFKQVSGPSSENCSFCSIIALGQNGSTNSEFKRKG